MLKSGFCRDEVANHPQDRTLVYRWKKKTNRPIYIPRSSGEPWVNFLFKRKTYRRTPRLNSWPGTSHLRSRRSSKNFWFLVFCWDFLVCSARDLSCDTTSFFVSGGLFSLTSIHCAAQNPVKSVKNEGLETMSAVKICCVLTNAVIVWNQSRY